MVKKEETILIDVLQLIIWGREFTLNVDYNLYDDEKISSNQEAMLTLLANHPDWIEASKLKVEEYCKKAVDEDERNQKKDNIFSYIKPEYLFVKHDELNPRIAIMCKYKYNLEHGLAIVFDRNGNIEIGIQDIIL